MGHKKGPTYALGAHVMNLLDVKEDVEELQSR